MAQPTHPVDISFIRVVEVNLVKPWEEEVGENVEPRQGDEQPISIGGLEIDTQGNQTGADNKKTSSIKQSAVIHRELLVASSGFFRNALEEGRWVWKEGKEKAIKVPEHDEAHSRCTQVGSTALTWICLTHGVS